MSSTDLETYDYCLIGGGTASCLIASRLSQQLPDHRILILEAGEHIRNDPKIQTPGLSATLQSDPNYDWQYSTAPEPGLNGRIIKQPRGKLVGGTSAINSHSVVFPSYEWHDRFAEKLLSDSGRSEWTSKNMADCYQRWQSGKSNSTTNNHVGLLDGVITSFPAKQDILQRQWTKVFEELGHPEGSPEFSESSLGAVTITNAVDAAKGERSHAGIAFLEPALARGSVTLETGAMVNKIVFAKQSAANEKLNAEGVSYTYRGKDCFARAREIIVCAGAFGSPTILERSGIGSTAILTAANIPVLYELPGVGENLQDHLNCGLACETRDDIPTRDEAWRNPEERKAALSEYEQKRTGRFSEGGAYSFAFTPLQLMETSSQTQQLNDSVKQCVNEEQNPGLKSQYSVLQEIVESSTEATASNFMLRAQRHVDYDSLPKDAPRFVDGNYVTVVAMLAHPFSRGSCHISPDPSKQPDIKFNYLSHPLDVEILARHLMLIENLFQTPAFAAITKPGGRRLPRSFPHPVVSLEDAKSILPINSATNYHPSSTCSMMREDLGGVVDETLRVYGTENVRVCDASVLPIIPRGNILTAVYAFAEKAAELICREA